MAALYTCTYAIAPTVFAQSASFIYTGMPTVFAPGSSFRIGISVVFTSGGTVNDLSGLSYWMVQRSPTSSFPFAITNRDTTGSMFTDLQSGLVYPQILDPINRNPNGTTTGTDLGALITSGTAGLPSGTYFVANVTFSVAANVAVGVYTIGNTVSATTGVGGRISVVTDSEGDTVSIAPSSFTIVIPEPRTYALLVAGGLSLGAALRRRSVGESKATSWRTSA